MGHNAKQREAPEAIQRSEPKTKTKTRSEMAEAHNLCHGSTHKQVKSSTSSNLTAPGNRSQKHIPKPADGPQMPTMTELPAGKTAANVAHGEEPCYQHTCEREKKCLGKENCKKSKHNQYKPQKLRAKILGSGSRSKTPSLHCCGEGGLQ